MSAPVYKLSWFSRWTKGPLEHKGDEDSIYFLMSHLMGSMSGWLLSRETMLGHRPILWASNRDTTGSRYLDWHETTKVHKAAIGWKPEIAQ